MSKSLGNGVDPMDVIDKYGADALRFSQQHQLVLEWIFVMMKKKFLLTGILLIKLWNATRFVLTNVDDINVTLNKEDLDLTDKWLLTKYNNTVKE